MRLHAVRQLLARMPTRIAYLLLLVLSTSTASTPLRSADVDPDLLSRFKVDDPSRDGWSTEVLQGRVSQQWKRFAGALTSDSGSDDRQLSSLVVSDVRFQELRPSQLTAVYRDSSLQVLRPTTLVQHFEQGPGRLAAALGRLLGWRASDFRMEFKVFRISLGKSIETHQLVAASGRDNGRFREIRCIWQTRWTRPTAEHVRPRLEQLRVVDYEETVAERGPFLSDCTEAVLGHNHCYQQQLAYGLDYWANRLLQTDASGMQGCAVGDVNGDGLEDIYLCQTSWLPNRLFVQMPDGTAQDRSREAGVDWHERTHGALLLDLDNDGDQDLVLSTTVALLVMENDGHGRFRLRTKVISARGAYSLAAADYDLDGDLDLFAGVYLARARRRQILAAPVPFQDARNGGRNVLLRNEGKWKFADVTSQVGMEEEASRRTFAMSWEDYDNDGDLDLYIANDYGRNNLFRNDQGHFIDVASLAGVEDQSFGMSGSWADSNRDGWMDLYVSNMFSAAGNRIAFQRQFQSDKSKQLRARFQYMARGNSLFQNTGHGSFADVSPAANVMVGLWAWGSQFADLNNDGWQDLLVVNGYYSRSKRDDL